MADPGHQHEPSGEGNPLDGGVAGLLHAFYEGLCERAQEAMDERNYQAIYALIEEALDTGARSQRGDYDI